MKYVLLLFFPLIFWCCNPKEEDVIIKPSEEEFTRIPVGKTNPAFVFVNYKPWFTKAFNKSNYQPLTGFYDSNDDIIQEYQLLLMKYCGIDALVIDWYGNNSVPEYKASLNATNAIVEKTAEAGLYFTIAYEDTCVNLAGRQSGRLPVEIAREDMKYIEDKYFSKVNNAKMENFDLMLTQGPLYFKTKEEWTEIMGVFKTQPVMLSWWTLSYKAGEKNSQGEFAWIDFNPYLDETNKIYSSAHRYKIGAVFQGYNVYKNSPHIFGIDSLGYEGGRLLQRTMDIADARKARYVQIVTWNDYQAGTMVEPTVERGFDDLERIQKWTGVDYGRSDLELIFEYYQKKEKNKTNTATTAQLKEVYSSLLKLDVAGARAKLAAIP